MTKSLRNFDQYIYQALEEWCIPGAAVAIVKDDDILHMKGYGLRDVTQGLPVTENTRFPIASMTKPFTAMGAALLVDEGLLKWDQPIRDVLPEFRLFDEYATQHATLRDLLSHRTGLPRHDNTWYYAGRPRQELVHSLRYLSPTNSFRNTWQYNNLMYETVGHLCARLTNSETWQEFIQTRILDVLGMTHTIPNFDESKTQFDNIALPYMLKYGTNTPQQIDAYENPLASPAGSMHSTVVDMVTWLKVHINNGVGKNKIQLVSPYNLKQLLTPTMLIPPTIHQENMFNNNIFSYGLGWFIEPYKGITLIHHGGNLDGYSLMAAFVPQEKLCIVVLTNINGKGLRNALMYESVDRALNFDGKDWGREFLKRNNENEKAALKGLQTSIEDQIENAPPIHPLKAYAGTYTTSGYSDMQIKWENNSLKIMYYGQWWPLNHYHYDVFEIDMSNWHVQQLIKVSFTMDIHGTIIALHIPIEPTLGDIVFSRKPLETNTEIQEELVGVYSYPLEAHQVAISLKEDSLFLTITGKDKAVLQYVQKIQDKLRFKFADSNQTIVEFSKNDNEYTKLHIKHPGITYECLRLETQTSGNFLQQQNEYEI